MNRIELEAKRGELIDLIASATRRLQNGDQSVEYQSVQDMSRSLAIIDSEISKLDGSTLPRCFTVRMNRGL